MKSIATVEWNEYATPKDFEISQVMSWMKLQQSGMKTAKQSEIKALAKSQTLAWHEQETKSESYLFTEYWVWHPFWDSGNYMGNLFLTEGGSNEKGYTGDIHTVDQMIESLTLLKELIRYQDEYELDPDDFDKLGIQQALSEED